jgi:serine/threonine protein kinase
MVVPARTRLIESYAVFTDIDEGSEQRRPETRRMGRQMAHAPPGYEFVQALGSGGFGDVYLARHLTLGRLVAVKEIAPHALADPDNIERFRREARVLAATHVASVVKVYDLDTTHDPAFLVMEYVPGGTLAELIATGPLRADQAIHLLGDVASALQAMAAQGLVHRDIKPDNVFVLPGGGAKLGDFGLARALVADSTFRTGGGAPVGTPAFFPPEVSQGLAEPDHHSDAYSFAVMAYQVLTGSLPYDAPDAISMITAHWRLQPRHPADALPGMPAAAADALLAGMSKVPTERPLPHQLVEELRRVPPGEWPSITATNTAPSPATRGVTTVATPAPWSGPTPAPPVEPTEHRRRRWPSRAALVIGVLAVAAAGIAGWTLLDPLAGPDRLDVRAVELEVEPGPTGTCPRAEFTFVATVRTNGAGGTLNVSWTRPDGESLPSRSVTLPEGQRDLRTELAYTFRGSEPLTGRAEVHIGGADEGSAAQTVEYTCPGG